MRWRGGRTGPISSSHCAAYGRTWGKAGLSRGSSDCSAYLTVCPAQGPEGAEQAASSRRPTLGITAPPVLGHCVGADGTSGLSSGRHKPAAGGQLRTPMELGGPHCIVLNIILLNKLIKF